MRGQVQWTFDPWSACRRPMPTIRARIARWKRVMVTSRRTAVWLAVFHALAAGTDLWPGPRSIVMVEFTREIGNAATQNVCPVCRRMRPGSPTLRDPLGRLRMTCSGVLVSRSVRTNAEPGQQRRAEPAILRRICVNLLRQNRTDQGRAQKRSPDRLRKQQLPCHLLGWQASCPFDPSCGGPDY